MKSSTFMTSLLPLACRFARAALLLALGLSPALARQGWPPYSLVHSAKVGSNLPIEDLQPIDAAQRRIQLDNDPDPSVPHVKRLRVADGIEVSIDPEHNGVWEILSDGSRLWRMRVRARGATDLRLGFARFVLPSEATFYIIGADGYYQGPYDATDAIGARFHTSVVPGDTATIELHLPVAAQLPPDSLRLTRVGVGFRDLFGREKGGGTGIGASRPCNVNVACPLGQSYLDEIRAVAYYEFDADENRNTYICSGTLLADALRDARNYFLTAAHCASSAIEAASMVSYWNYQSTQCATLSPPPGGFLNDDLHGATLRATRADVDFTLIELAQTPPAAWDVYRAGWDASGGQPAATIGIHHPSGDVKKITAGPAPSTVASCIADAGAADTHWQTGPYSQGTTEGGSSGSGLFIVASSNPRARQLIGTLSGGDAACSSLSPSQPNQETDCYGKFSVAWNGSSASTRLRDWLDPANSGVLSLQGGDEVPPASIRAHSQHAIPAPLLSPTIRWATVHVSGNPVAQ